MAAISRLTPVATTFGRRIKGWRVGRDHRFGADVFASPAQRAQGNPFFIEELVHTLISGDRQRFSELVIPTLAQAQRVNPEYIYEQCTPFGEKGRHHAWRTPLYPPKRAQR